MYTRGIDCVSRKIPSFLRELLVKVLDMMLMEDRAEAEVLEYCRTILAWLRSYGDHARPVDFATSLSESIKLNKEPESYTTIPAHAFAAQGIRRAGGVVVVGDPVQYVTVADLDNRGAAKSKHTKVSERAVGLESFDPTKHVLDVDFYFDKACDALRRIFVVYDQTNVERTFDAARYQKEEPILTCPLFPTMVGTFRVWPASTKRDAPFVARSSAALKAVNGGKSRKRLFPPCAPLEDD